MLILGRAVRWRSSWKIKRNWNWNWIAKVWQTISNSARQTSPPHIAAEWPVSGVIKLPGIEEIGLSVAQQHKMLQETTKNSQKNTENSVDLSFLNRFGHVLNSPTLSVCLSLCLTLFDILMICIHGFFCIFFGPQSLALLSSRCARAFVAHKS